MFKRQALIVKDVCNILDKRLTDMFKELQQLINKEQVIQLKILKGCA